MNKDSRILVIGHNDIIEKSLYAHFKFNGYTSIYSSSHSGINLAIQASVYEFFQKVKPEYVFLGSTRSGGIEMNVKNPAEFLYHNSESQNNILYSSWKFGAKKLLYFAGSCVYPKACPQPMKEEHLLTGTLEQTSEPYSVAKIAGIKLCQAFRKQYGFNAIVMVPATVYGPGSDVNIETAHVIGALMGKFANAVIKGRQKISVWGTGNPRREFLYVDDFVQASLHLMDYYNKEKVVNVGSGSDITIKELATMIARVVGFEGEVIFDETKPDGTMKKLLDSSYANSLGWKARIPFEQGLRKTYDGYRDRLKQL
ncbi:MAG: GDP-L-fucose synthase [Candidatus Omnitrophica bacterium]|nr:GDP-L-fucose synthase [Candidatus Omnitrophota bacterium]MCK5260145.1 GDP-L-fucose synthase [Candidatus Omnitrophota bacterium]